MLVRSTSWPSSYFRKATRSKFASLGSLPTGLLPHGNGTKTPAISLRKPPNSDPSEATQGHWH